MTTPSLTILGGGLCGLYAAHQALELGARVSLFEKEAVFGGLAAGHQFEGNWFDLGVHMLHAFDQEVFATCQVAMGEERLEVPLKAHIKWGGTLYHYPLRGRDILAGIPPLTLARCLTGLVLAELESRMRRRPLGDDAETALIDLYGSPLYEFFFEDFTHRYWGIHPRDLSAEFVRRKMPRLSAIDVFKNLLEKLRLAKPRDATEGALRFETLHYSRTGSETLPRRLAQSLIDRGAKLQGESPIERIHHNGSTITGVTLANAQHRQSEAGAHRLEASSSTRYLSTLPLPLLVRQLDPPPPEPVLAAAEKLRFKPMTVYALLVNQEKCMDALYTYYRDRIFHRVGEPKNAGLEVTPKGHTTLIVETTCEVDDPKWQGDAFSQILADLQAENLCPPEAVVYHHLIHSHHAYPIFSLGFEQHLATVQEYLARFDNLQSTGRQGSFSYPNMHSAMRMGATAAAELLS